jgi:TolB protein
LNRRQLLALGWSASASTAAAAPLQRLLFTSNGKTCLVDADGRGFRVLELRVEKQVTWQPADAFGDGRRLLMLSMEERRDGPGRPFDQYYHQTPTHIWEYDLDTGRLAELCTRDRLAPFYTPQLLLPDGRLLVQAIPGGVGQVLNVRLDGSDAREFSRAGEGLPYGFSASPDGRRIAFHLASPQGYQVWTADPDGKNRVRLAGAPGHLYFGTAWSPDGKWVVYVDCLHGDDPGHDWADVCIGRADGSEHRMLTSGQAMWFAATYGDPKSRGGGSNVPAWMPDGSIVFPRRVPGSRVPWVYRRGRPDVDHFNRDYRPEEARGGVRIVRLWPESGRVATLATVDPPRWDFRAAPSPDGRRIAFCRARIGEAPALWVMKADGTSSKLLHPGLDGMPADHPRWL